MLQIEGGQSITTKPYPGSERPSHGLQQSFEPDAEVSRLRREKA